MPLCLCNPCFLIPLRSGPVTLTPGGNPGLISSSSSLYCCLTTSEPWCSGSDVFTLVRMTVSLRLGKKAVQFVSGSPFSDNLIFQISADFFVQYFVNHKGVSFQHAPDPWTFEAAHPPGVRAQQGNSCERQTSEIDRCWESAC